MYQGFVIGTIGLLPVSKSEVKIVKLVVHPYFRRRKVGKLLLKAANNFATEHGYTEALLETNSKLNVANSLFRELGFVEFQIEQTSLARADLAFKKIFN